MKTYAYLVFSLIVYKRHPNKRAAYHFKLCYNFACRFQCKVEFLLNGFAHIDTKQVTKDGYENTFNQR